MSGNDSRIKKDKTPKAKQKLVFAKDKKQAVLAAVVLLAFFGNSIYMGVKYMMEKNPPPAIAPTQETQKEADAMAQMQQKRLESMNMAEDTAPGEQSQVSENSMAQDANNIYNQTVGMQNGANPNAKMTSEDGVEVISKKNGLKKNQKMVMITVDNSGRSNPFLPAGENVIPGSLPYLSAPPETVAAGTDATKVMTTTISGILYDKYSPSAIINIEGTDYLVKRGDVINHYRILGIEKTQVLVQLGKNVYKAGVGELLTQTDLNFNTISNLNKKFGGNDVNINVRKKG